MNRPIEDLKFAVEQWKADGLHVSEILARASSVCVAQAAFAEAARVRPTARLTLRLGARVIEARGAADETNHRG